MPDEAIKPEIRAALRFNEIGDRTPYEMSFAGKGKSGASFGFMQGDLHAGKAVVQDAFREAMQDAGMSAQRIDALLAALSRALTANPLDPLDTADVNAALSASAPVVDTMDEQLLQTVYGELDACVAAATGASRTIAVSGLLYIACWCNMSGFPDQVIVWLKGGVPAVRKPVPSAPARIDGIAARAYLAGTDYFVENPQNLPHLDDAVSAGLGMAGVS